MKRNMDNTIHTICTKAGGREPGKGLGVYGEAEVERAGSGKFKPSVFPPPPTVDDQKL